MVFKRKKNKKTNVLSIGDRALEGVEIHRRITQDAPSSSFSKDNEKSQPQPQEKGRPSVIDSGDEN